MLFKDDDILTSLKLEGTAANGKFDLVFWKVDGGSDITSQSALMASLHEWYHWHLNTSTAFGAVLQIFALISQMDENKPSRYNHVVDSLVNQCRFAHEVYATWLGINAVKDSRYDLLEEQLLAEYPGYREYYAAGEKIVADIEDQGIAAIVLTAVINICFQSAKIAEIALNDLDEFRTSAFDLLEFPNVRLNRILNHFTSKDFLHILRSYRDLEEATDLNTFVAEQNSDPNRIFSAKDFEWINKVIHHFFNILAPLFGEKNSSLIPDGHIALVQALLEQVKRKFPGQDDYPHIPSNLSSARNVLVSFENETVVIRDRPVEALFKRPAQLTDADRTKLNSLRPEPQVLMACSPSTMYRQYHWVNEDDRNWLAGTAITVTCVQFWDDTQIVFVPTETKEELWDVLNGHTEDFKLIAYIMLSAWQDEWEKQWWNFFYNECAEIYYLNDVSLLIYLESLIEQRTAAKYSIFRYKTENREFRAIVFQFPVEGRVVKSVICPCSPVHALLISDHIDKYARDIQYEFVMSKEQEDYTFLLLRNLYNQFHYWEFKTLWVSDELLNHYND